MSIGGVRGQERQSGGIQLPHKSVLPDIYLQLNLKKKNRKLTDKATGNSAIYVMDGQKKKKNQSL